MSPNRKCVVDGKLIEEYYWSGKLIVYIDHHVTVGTYKEAVEAAEAAARKEP